MAAPARAPARAAPVPAAARAKAPAARTRSATSSAAPAAKRPSRAKAAAPVTSRRERLAAVHLQQRQAAKTAAVKTGAAADTGREHAGRATETIQRGFAEGGQHALAAELLLFIGIVALRAVATYGPAPVIKGKTEPKNLPADQFGPLFILGNGLALYFVLAFMAARGGTWAKVAVAAGLTVDVALLLKSTAHLSVLTAVYASPRKYTPVSLTATRPTEDIPDPLAFELSTGNLPPNPKGASAGSLQSYARRLMPHFGLSQADFGDLVKLWNQESGWRVQATNPNSGAYGIPQALPANKMASAGADWRTDAATQIRWGLQYIKDRYGSVSAAWDHELHFGWY